MLAYYEAIAPWLLPHLMGRPLTLGRFPAGIDGPGFAQTECRGRPDWMRTEAVRLRTGEVRHQCVVDDLDSLLWVANLGSIELHAFPARAGRPDEPAFVVFDLDPGPGADLLDCCRVALWVRAALGDVGLDGFAKASGGAGVHVEVPLAAGHRFDAARTFARDMAGRLAARQRSTVTDRRAREARTGKVLVDWMPTAPRALMVVPYSLRATDRPSVATPLRWAEIEQALELRCADALRYEPSAVVERAGRLGDLHAPMLETTQRLPSVR